jgi:hypothetical protein
MHAPRTGTVDREGGGKVQPHPHLGGGAYGLRRLSGRLAVAEVVGSRKRAEDVGVLGTAPGELTERVEFSHDDISVSSKSLEPPPRQKQRLSPDERAEALVHLRRHDQVDLAELVLQEHEDDSPGGRRALPGHSHPRDGD